MGKSVAVWKRFIAYIIDYVLISLIIISPLTSSIKTKFEGLTFIDMFDNFYSLFDLNFWLIFFLSLLFVLMYWTFLEWKFSQSVGKIIMNLYVESIDKKPVSFFSALVRNISKLFTFLLIIDTIYMLVKKNDQRYFEELSHTHVIEVKNG